MELGVDLHNVILLSIGLAMYAFSVALVTGFGMGRVKLVDLLRVSGVFWLAHIVMPTLDCARLRIVLTHMGVLG